MLPFSKRPPPPEEYFLRSGDFEAVSGNSQRPVAQAAYGQPIPNAPRAPVFARQAAHTPYGFSQAQQQQQQYADMSAPPPPHSLAPVAMMSGSYHTATGTNPVQTASLREKPSLKWGVMIALTGALLGGVLGLGMDAKRQQARAAAASEARDAAPITAPALPAAVQPPIAPANAIVANPNPAPLAVNGIIAPPQTARTAAVAPTVLPPVAPVAVANAAKPEAPAAKNDKRAPAPKFQAPPAKHPTFVAAKVSKPKDPPPEPVAKAEPAPKPEAPAAKPAKSDASTKAAQQLLEQASKDTTNTL